MAAEPLLLRGGTIVTMDASRRVFQGDVLVRSGRIADVDRAVEAPPNASVIDCRGRHVLPGFVQGHVHLGQTLFRGLAEGKALLPWLRERIWPLEAALDDESAYWAARMGAGECLAGGTTTIQDMGLVHGTEGMLRAIRESGIRAIVGKTLMDSGTDAPPRLVEAPQRALADAEDIYRRWHGAADGRIHGALCPRFILSCSAELWEGVVGLAQSLGAPVHTHLLEHPEEEAEVRRVLKVGQMEYLDRLGVLDTDLRVAHGVHLSQRHIDVLLGRSLAVVHCPGANLKLGSGSADLLFLAGIANLRPALGCDSAACNNGLDILPEMRLATLLQAVRHGPGAWSARATVELATIAGARALRLEHEIGSLEAGKAADVVVLDLRDGAPFAAEEVDVYDRVVFGAGPESVETVMVDGVVRVRGGRVLGVDETELRQAARRALRNVLARIDRPWWAV